MTDHLYPFLVKPDSWSLPVIVRAYSAEDADAWARIYLLERITPGEHISADPLYDVPEDNNPYQTIPVRSVKKAISSGSQVKPKTMSNNKKGRPMLEISREAIIDALRKHKTVKAAADQLGCSRGHIYGHIGNEEIRRIINGGSD